SDDRQRLCPCRYRASLVCRDCTIRTGFLWRAHLAAGHSPWRDGRGHIGYGDVVLHIAPTRARRCRLVLRRASDGWSLRDLAPTAGVPLQPRTGTADPWRLLEPS